jgi:hypothetical protein
MSVLLHELMRVQVLPGSFTTAHEEQMVNAETEWISPADKAIYSHGERNAPVVNGCTKRRVVTCPPYEDMRQTSPEQKQTEQSRGANEHEEVPIITTSDAVIEPDTMMILGLDAIVANTTVMGTRRSPDVAAFAILGWNLHGGVVANSRHHHSPLCGWRAKVQWVGIRITRREWVQIAGKYLAWSATFGNHSLGRITYTRV